MIGKDFGKVFGKDFGKSSGKDSGRDFGKIKQAVPWPPDGPYFCRLEKRKNRFSAILAQARSVKAKKNRFFLLLIRRI